MLYLLENEAAWATANLKNGGRNANDGRNAKIVKKILLDECYLLFEEYLQETNCLYPETRPRNKPKFWIKSTRK